MKIDVTPQESMTVTLSRPHERRFFEVIAEDAFLAGGPSSLSGQLSHKMEEDCEWDDFIVPELTTHFKSQVALVQQTLMEAEVTGEGEDMRTVFTIEAKDYESWYGALNQAALQLEAAHQLSKYREADFDDLAPPVRSAMGRNHFYSRLKGVFLRAQLNGSGLDFDLG